MRDYMLIRSDRRSLSLEITPALTLTVRAPRCCPQKDIDRFVADHEDWIAAHLPVAERRLQARMARQVTPEEEEALRRKAAAVIPERVTYYSRLMGLKPTGIRITGAQKRFGSCSGKNSLCFSWRLMQYPMEAVDYVVVHELAHIRHHNHSRDFYRLIERYMPDYRQREALLRD